MGIKSHGGSGFGEVENYRYGEDPSSEEERVEQSGSLTELEDLPFGTKFSSGLRFRAVLEDAERELEGKQNDCGYERVIASVSQLQNIVDEADGLGDPTVPDLQVLGRWQSEQPRPDRAVLEMEKQLTEVFQNQVRQTLSWADGLLKTNKSEDVQNLADSSTDNSADVVSSQSEEWRYGRDGFEDNICSPKVLLEEQEVRRYLDELHQWRSTLKPMRRAVHLVEKHFGYVCPWWDSPNALVRVWGQLDCALQVFSDERMVRDLVEVLGKNVVTAGLQPREGRLYGFAYLTENAARLKKMIAEKYREHSGLLDAIIRKQDKNE